MSIIMNVNIINEYDVMIFNINEYDVIAVYLGVSCFAQGHCDMRV